MKGVFFKDIGSSNHWMPRMRFINLCDDWTHFGEKSGPLLIANLIGGDLRMEMIALGA